MKKQTLQTTYIQCVAFTKKMPQIKNLSYSERLDYLKLNSQQRRLEQYKIIYIWKILEKLSPNCGINSDENELTGRMCQVPPIEKKEIPLIKH